jgi:hypothetical protein
LIDPDAKPLAPEKFDGISAKTMSLGDILSRLGPARRDIGSGLHLLEWRCTDGRSFIVGTPDWTDLKRSPMYAEWKNGNPRR